MRLWRKQALSYSLLLLAGFALLGVTEAAFSYREAMRTIRHNQALLAREISSLVVNSVHRVSQHVQATGSMPWNEADWLSIEDRREEFLRILKLEPSVRDLSHFDALGRADAHVSRVEVSDLPSPGLRWFSTPGVPRWANGLPPANGSVEYVNDYEPHLLLTIPDPAMGAGLTVARVNLRTLASGLRDALRNNDLQAYALDAHDHIVLHADGTVMLARETVDLANARPAQPWEPGLNFRRNVEGAKVLSSVFEIPELGWRLVIEQPRKMVLEPVLQTLLRTALITLLGVASVGWLALLVVGRTSRPIEALHQGALALSEGRLDTRISIRTGDELEDLAKQFNAMAENLQSLYNNMAATIEERTRALREANQHKSEFLTHMSHELRTPLNSVIGFSDLLREEIYGPLNEKQLEYANDIHASGEHLLALINDVLDLSKIEAGQMALELAEVDLPSTLQGAAAMMRERCLRQQLRLKLVLPPELGAWQLDARRFKQIVINLLSNAVKFTPNGGTITLSAGTDAAEGLWVAVQDTGVGIAPEHQALVFEEFRQVGDDLLTASQGTGLGLPLVRRLVRMHGGEVTLQSTPGVGSTFRFNIPAPGADHPQAPA